MESKTKLLKSAVTSLTSSQQELVFNCHRDVSNLDRQLQSKMQQVRSSLLGLDSHFNQQTEEYDQQKIEISTLKSKMTQHQEMPDKKLESSKEMQKSRDETITSLQQLKNAESLQPQKEVPLLHQNLDGLVIQVQDVKEEMQNLKHAPCNHNLSISKHQAAVEQDVAFQGLQKT